MPSLETADRSTALATTATGGHLLRTQARAQGAGALAMTATEWAGAIAARHSALVSVA